MTFRIGVVDLAYGTEPGVGRRSELAAADGFEHIDVVLGADAGGLALPVGCPIAFPRPEPTWCSTPAPPAGDDAWDRTVRWWRAAPQALCEPWAGGAVRSIEHVRALAEAVPGVRFLIDTGHVMAWGGDILELLPYAAHVQLRDARPGEAQVAPGDGEVDFAAVLARLEALGYDGVLSVEYFDLPEHGWPCADPRAHAVALRNLL
ncbi:MAG: sugar phosphate isomerase/epimerase family protein [Acidimicrobiia bacterium]